MCRYNLQVNIETKMMKNLIIILLFIILLIIITFPLALNITTAIPGFFSSDELYSSIWDSWRIKYSVAHNLSLRFTNLISYPFSLNLYSGGYCTYIWMGWHHLLSLLTTPILTHNIQVLFNIFLSGILTYSLVLYLTKNIPGAIISGIIFAFCPYQLVRVWQHLGLTYNEWIPLTILSAVLLREIPTRKNIILFFVSLILLFSFDYVVMYLAFTSLTIYFLYLLLYDWRNKFFFQRERLVADLKYFRNITIIGISAFTLLLPQFFPVIKNRILHSSKNPASAFNPYHRPFEDLFAQSARPLSYFLPASVHPVFGKFTENFIGTSLYGESFTEHTLYLGWVPLVLAFAAFRRWRRLRKEVYKSGTVPFGDSPWHREDFYVGFFVFLAIVAWFFSQPPWWQIGPLRIYMPSFFMYKILPMYRAYCRFGIVLMLAVAVLAGFGLKFILERFKSNKTKIVVTILACALALFEFWNWPPYKVIDISRVPAAYYWLKSQPKDVVIAEYPLDAGSPNEMYKFYQTAHEKRMINGTIPGTPANVFAQTIVRLSQPKTASVLKGIGVKYVLVHHDGYLETGLMEDKEDLKRIPQSKGLKLIRSFAPEECPDKDIICVRKTGPIDVYEVVTEPVKTRTQ